MYILAGVVIGLALIGCLTVGCWLGIFAEWAWSRFQAWRRADRTSARLDELCRKIREG